MNKIKPSNSNVSKKLLLFVIASVIFWFMTKLSKEYENTISYPIEFVDLPNNKLFKTPPIKNISIQVKSSGFKLIASYLLPNTIKIDASSPEVMDDKSYLLLPKQRLSIQKQINSGVTIDHFIEDTVSLNLGTLQTKKVPVTLRSDFNFDVGYGIEGDIKLKPDSVLVIGAKEILDTVYSVSTEQLSKTKINGNIEEEIRLLKFPITKNIKLESSEVTIKAKVSKFTEGSLELPFSIINLPENLVISTFPQKVKATYTVSLDNFSNVNADLFEVVCDYNRVSDGITYLIPKLKKSSDLVKNVRITPNRIDFILEEK